MMERDRQPVQMSVLHFRWQYYYRYSSRHYKYTYDSAKKKILHFSNFGYFVFGYFQAYF
jgi:hypothetical protein